MDRDKSVLEFEFEYLQKALHFDQVSLPGHLILDVLQLLLVAISVVIGGRRGRKSPLRELTWHVGHAGFLSGSEELLKG